MRHENCHTWLSVSLTVPIPVRFNQTTYSVVEGEKPVSITLVAADHTFSFSVTVSTRDGTASCKWQTAVYGQTCLTYIAHNLCNSISFVHLVITVNYYSSVTISLHWAKTITVFYHPSARSDYSSLTRRSVHFPARVNQVTFTVTIRDNRLVQLDKEFYIELEIPSSTASRSVVKVPPDNATVIIQDDDGECCLKCCKTEHNQNILIAINVHLNITALWCILSPLV